jgi:hypothetical protein
LEITGKKGEIFKFPDIRRENVTSEDKEKYIIKIHKTRRCNTVRSDGLSAKRKGLVGKI